MTRERDVRKQNNRRCYAQFGNAGPAIGDQLRYEYRDFVHEGPYRGWVLGLIAIGEKLLPPSHCDPEVKIYCREEAP